MSLLVAGLVLVLGVHLIPVVAPWRAALAARLGERGYRAAFSLVALAGLIAIVAGYARAGPEPAFTTARPWAAALSPVVMAVALTLLAASKLSGYIRRTVRHPMLAGTILWAGLHLAANGEARSVVLFGAFLAWALVDLVSACARGTARPFEPRLLHDAIAVGLGVPATIVLAWAHGPLFGAAIGPFAR